MRLIRHRLNVVPNRNRSCVCFLSTSLFSLPVLFLALICPRVFFGGTRFTISFRFMLFGRWDYHGHFGIRGGLI